MKIQNSNLKMKNNNIKLKIILTLMIFSAVFLLPKISQAATYYVATNGSDSNPGTIDQPWRTITKGLQTLQNGDILNIRGGIYRLMDENSNTFVFSRPGATINNFVTIQAYPVNL